MPGPVNEEQTVTLISSTSISEDGEITPGILPIPALRTSTPKKNDENTALEALLEEEFKEKKNSNANSRDPLTLETQVSPPSLEETKGEETHVDVPQNPTLSRSPFQETVFSPPWNSEILEDLQRTNSSSIPPTGSLPSYTSAADGSKKSLLTNSKFNINDDAILKNKKTNRFLPRAKYAMQQKGFIIFGASAIILSISAALLYLQDKAKFIAFFTNSPKYITIPVIALAALLAIGPIFFATRQFIDTEEHSIQKKDADKILAEVLEHQPKDKAIKSVRLEYSNGTHSNFVLNAWEAKQGFTNIDEKVITRTNKIKSVINDRPIFTALFTGVVAANIAFPLGLLATHGVNGVQKFYQNPLTNNIGLSLLIGSGILALLIVGFGIHYYRKTNCTNLIYSEEEIDPKDVNGKFIEEIKRERTNVLGENHSKDAKRSSLTLEQVVVQSHNCKDIVYSVG
ncbi:MULTISPECIES: hypothetical protein [Wolbachia]|uniref:hypothetical protein n=1 Tax=Wolbachia TaxID=953 RepID=UPI00004CA4D6|nr:MULTISPECIES: hypothetical protein [Wolbachia]MDX5487376.1 hypothetical protein [Wolbachia endosymbiont of Andrena praecox]MDX5497368.1 hypothetical protein [Wolbachia endosymbiont of Lasioglossum nitidulum]MDX5509762.1 hypothetical protein [Wolbachia endosymbiont of Lasioglossum morio]MDX5542796.1 hypothetical protein [Wolbachia endosymbiont of Andrena apicata]MDX5561358.1 hypothetical protein [Wolbachia endosymbiont of Andrena bicolor]POG51818.1 hypothetical protein BJU59_03550 [Wolbachi